MMDRLLASCVVVMFQKTALPFFLIECLVFAYQLRISKHFVNSEELKVLPWLNRINGCPLSLEKIRHREVK